MSGEGRAASCGRCGTALPDAARFCPECGTALTDGEPGRSGPPPRDPREYTPPHLIRRVLSSRSALEGERKQVTVLFVDLQGSTSVAADVDPERWHDILDAFFGVLTEGVHRYEGTVNQYTGDGIMALFGAPVAHEDHAHRACAAALELRDALAAFMREVREREGLDLAARLGLHSGEVVVGTIGDDLRMDYTAQGYTVGIAARIEQSADPGTVRLSDVTARLVEGFFRLRDLGAATLRGVRDPIGLFELQGPGSLRTRLDAARARRRGAWVGRESECGLLEGARDQALDGYGRVVAIVGEAGVGKTRLCLEVLERCAARGMTLHTAQCPTHGRNVPLSAMASLVRSLVGVESGEAEQIVRQRAEAAVAEWLSDVAEALPVVLDLLGMRGPEAATLPADAAGRQRLRSATIGRLLQRRSPKEPAAIFVDDVHWIDAESEALLRDLVQSVGYTRTLLLLNHRPGYTPPGLDVDYAGSLTLEPLEGETLVRFVANLLGTDPSVAEIAPRLAERSAGNPFFAEALVEHLAASGVLTGSLGAYTVAGDVADDLALPDAVRTLLAARLDRLPEPGKEIVQTAAVLGRSFPEPVLRYLLDLSDDAFDAELDALREAELIELESDLPERTFAFRHPLLQEVAYGAQVAARRSERHEAVARAIEEMHAHRLGEHAAVIAHHWEAAGRTRVARRWRERAALRVSRIQIRRPPGQDAKA